MAAKATERTVRVLTLDDFDHLLQDSDIMVGLMDAVSAALRARYGKEWLLQFSLPNGLTEADHEEIRDSLLDHAVSLVEQGLIPSVASVVEPTTLWVQRLIRSRGEQWARLCEATKRAATSYSSRHNLAEGKGGDSIDEDLFLTPEERAEVTDLRRYFLR